MNAMRTNALARAAIALFLVCPLSPQAAELADPIEIATRIQKEVADLRGLSFKQPVPMEKQTAGTRMINSGLSVNSAQKALK